MISHVPTREGLARYRGTEGFYYRIGEAHLFACICAPDCSRPCRGHCGCDACSAQWINFDHNIRIDRQG